MTNASPVIYIRVEPEMKQAIEEIAKRKLVKQSVMLKMWLAEKIEAERTAEVAVSQAAIEAIE